ncbi:MAG: pyridoxamine 5'-phosphate oxidase family protein, partial [Actinobacteria bacterium]
MTWQEFLNERPIAVIATPRADGTPHAVPVELQRPCLRQRAGAGEDHLARGRRLRRDHARLPRQVSARRDLRERHADPAVARARELGPHRLGPLGFEPC